MSPLEQPHPLAGIALERLAVSTPGRVCLFGEHQDYLGLPVIPCAISLRIGLEGSRRQDHKVRIDLPDIKSAEAFSLDGPLPYVAERDYFRSVVNVLRRHGFTFSTGFDCRVHGEIPINSGTSSSSALIVTWVIFLAAMSDQRVELAPSTAAVYAHEAEVLEFGEPGGMMDHYSTALGGVLFLEFEPRVVIEPLNPALGTFVLGDSGEPKDTKGILSRVKDQVVAVSRRLSQLHPEFSLHRTAPEDVRRYEPELTADQADLLRGTLTNREITARARQALRAPRVDHGAVGALLNAHQDVLRDVLRISTPKIDRMIDAALAAGALGGKINGSGGGGCMFVYAPERPEAVAEAIAAEGGRPFIVRADRGAVRT
jgi:galactokinase